MAYKIRIHKDALLDIQEATDWYNKILPGLGGRFQQLAKEHINSLKTTAHHHSIRYSDVRCCLIRRFPFLIHYVIAKNDMVEIFAVIHTSRNPRIWIQRRNK